MAHQELLLIQPVENLGNEGEQVKVKAGYARNYLLPRKMAMPLTRANRKQVEVLRKRSEERLRNLLLDAQQKAEKLAALRVALAVKTGPGGKVFGAVTAAMLQERLQQDGLSLERRQISLHTPAKTLGKHVTRIRLHPEVNVDFEFEIVSENPIEAENPAEQA